MDIPSFIFFTATNFYFTKITLIDLKERRIYDFDLYKVFFLCLLYKFYIDDIVNTLCGAVLGIFIGFCIYKISLILYNDEVFGFGDVLLLAVLGAYFGFPNIYHYFTICILCSGLFLGLLILINSKLKNTEIPLAPMFIFWVLLYSTLDFPNINHILWKFF